MRVSRNNLKITGGKNMKTPKRITAFLLIVIFILTQSGTGYALRQETAQGKSAKGIEQELSTAGAAGKVSLKQRFQLWCLTRTRGLYKQGAFKDATPADIDRAIADIKVLRAKLKEKRINPTDTLQYGLPAVAKISKTPEESEKDFIVTEIGKDSPRL